LPLNPASEASIFRLGVLHKLTQIVDSISPSLFFGPCFSHMRCNPMLFHLAPPSPSTEGGNLSIVLGEQIATGTTHTDSNLKFSCRKLGCRGLGCCGCRMLGCCGCRRLELSKHVVVSRIASSDLSNNNVIDKAVRAIAQKIGAMRSESIAACAATVAVGQQIHA
jgi:hypothetical protein